MQSVLGQTRMQEKEPSLVQILDKVKNQPSQTNEAMTEFFELYSDDIYSFPIRFYNFSEDGAGDFYLYAFEHLKNGKRLMSFKGESKFSTWFYSVLRHLTIDFLRLKKESVKSSSYLKMNSDGELVNVIEEIPDERENISWEDDLFEEFYACLEELKIEQRILFKLAYVHFFQLTGEEVKWLAAHNDQNEEMILKKISSLKEVALKKVNQVKPFEDKLNVSFEKITSLETYLFQFFRENPNLPKDRDKWSEDYQNSRLPVEIIEAIQNLSRKKKKHLNLVLKQKKSLLSIRISYKDLNSLMKSGEGVLSVQLLRVIDKLGKMMKN